MHDLWSSDLAPLIFVAFFGVVGWLGYPIAAALRRRIEGRAGGASEEAVRALRDEVAELRDRLDRSGASAERVAELEERLDFAERLLAQSRAVPTFPAPGPGE